MINKDELLYKLNAVKIYLEKHNGKEYKLYDKLCPGTGERDSNIIEYIKDIEVIVQELFKKLESYINSLTYKNIFVKNIHKNLSEYYKKIDIYSFKDFCFFITKRR